MSCHLLLNLLHELANMICNKVPHEQHEKVQKQFGNILNKLDLANRGQRLGPTSTCHHRLIFVHLRETGTITISGSLQNACNILRSDIVFVSVFLFVCFILKSFTSWSVTILNRLELPVVCLVSLSLSAVTVCTRLASISTSKSHPHTCTMYMTAPSLHTCCFTSAIPFRQFLQSLRTKL